MSNRWMSAQPKRELTATSLPNAKVRRNSDPSGNVYGVWEVMSNGRERAIVRWCSAGGGDGASQHDRLKR